MILHGFFKTRNVVSDWDKVAPIGIILVFFCGFFSLFINSKTLVIIFITYGIILLESRIALRRFICGFPGANVLVTLLRVAFFFIPLPFLGFPVLNPVSWGVFVAIIWGILLQIPQFRDIGLLLSREFNAMLSPYSRSQRLNAVLLPLLSAVAQEYFYRGTMLPALANICGIWAVLIVALLFTFEHLMHFDTRQAFDKCSSV